MPSRKPPQAALAATAPTPMHVGLTEYIKRQTGYEADPLSVSLAVRLGVAYRASDENKARRAETHKSREQRAAEAAERKRQRIAERAAKLREEAERLEREAGVTPAAKPERKPRRSRAQRNAEIAEAKAKREAAKAALTLVKGGDEPDPHAHEADLAIAGVEARLTEPGPFQDGDEVDDGPDDDDTEIIDDGGADVFVLPTGEAALDMVTGNGNVDPTADEDEAEFQAGPGGDGAVPIITFDDGDVDDDEDDDF